MNLSCGEKTSFKKLKQAHRDIKRKYKEEMEWVHDNDSTLCIQIQKQIANA